MRDRILIIGSDGYIGRQFVYQLTESDRFEVSVIKNSQHFENEFSRIIKSEHFDFIVWLASKVNPYFASTLLHQVDSELEAFRKALILITSSGSVIKSFIFISSGGCVYSPAIEAITEASPLKGKNGYGEMKLFQEQLLVSSGLNYTILRVANIFGANQPIGRNQGLIGEWCSRIKNHLECEVYGSLDDFRYYIHVDDVISAIRISLERLSLGVFNMGSGESTSIRDLMAIFTEIFPPPIVFSHKSARDFDFHGYSLDISKAKKELAWLPIKSGTQGIRNFLKEFKNGPA